MYLRKHFSANNVLIEEFPFRRELAMEAYLIENPTVLALGTEGFNDVVDVKEEITLAQGRLDRGTDGRLDLVVNYANTHLGVAELKLGTITLANLSQLESYLAQKVQIMDKLGEFWNREISGEPKWMGLLIGTRIEPALMNKLREGYYYDDIPIAGVTIQRYKEPNAGSIYVVTDTYFVEKVRNNDLTKYRFRGEVFGKGRLVLAVIKDYVRENPDKTYSELEKQFPQELQGKQGTFTTEAKARLLMNDTGYRRHYLEPEELVALKDATGAVSSQWGLPNIGRFIDHALKLGFDISEVR